LSSSVTAISGAAIIRRAGREDENREPNQQTPYRRFDRAEKLRLRNDGGERPAGKGQRGQGDRIGVGAGDEPHLASGLLVAFVGAAGRLERALRDRQQRLIRALHVGLVGVRIGRGDRASAAAEDERGAGLADRKLRQKLREPRVLDDDGKYALAFLVDIDRADKGDRRTQAHGMRGDLEPARLVARDAFLVPFLIGDDEIGAFEATLLELDVIDDHLVGVDAPLHHAVDRSDLHHLQAQIAELVRGEEVAVRPAECHPGDARLRLEL
jgi:hypothetical protein